jgi:hypothetical protein
MFIAYLTTDEVNLAEAARFAAESGATLYPLFPKEAVTDECFDAVVYDMDYLPERRRARILAELLAGPVLPLRCVHSFNLEEDQEEALRRNGVVVHRRLEREMFQHLTLAEDQTLATVTGVLDDAATQGVYDLQWVDESSGT